MHINCSKANFSGKIKKIPEFANSGIFSLHNLTSSHYHKKNEEKIKLANCFVQSLD